MKQKWIVEKEFNILWFEKLDYIAKHKSRIFSIPNYESGDLYDEIYLYGYNKYMQADEINRPKFEIKSYFSAIAHNMLIDLARKNKGRVYANEEKITEVPLEYEMGEEIPIPDETVYIEDEIIRREERTLLYRGIELLKSEEEQKLIVAFLHGKSYEEVAQELNITVNNVAVRKKRVVKKLKVIIAEIETENIKDTALNIAGGAVGLAIGGIVAPGIFTSVLGNIANKVLVAGILKSVNDFFKITPKTSVLHLVEDLLENY